MGPSSQSGTVGRPCGSAGLSRSKTKRQLVDISMLQARPVIYCYATWISLAQPSGGRGHSATTLPAIVDQTGILCFVPCRISFLALARDKEEPLGDKAQASSAVETNTLPAGNSMATEPRDPSLRVIGAARIPPSSDNNIGPDELQSVYIVPK